MAGLAVEAHLHPRPSGAMAGDAAFMAVPGERRLAVDRDGMLRPSDFKGQ